MVGRVHALPQVLDVEGALADNEAFAEVMEQGDLGLEIGEVTRRAFAQTDDPFVREEAQEQPFAAAAIRLDVVEEEGFGVGDFHGCVLRGLFEEVE